MTASYGIILAGAAVIAIAMTAMPSAPPDVHAEVQQRLLEAELGSATTFHFSSTARVRVPGGADAAELLDNLQSASPEARWQAADELALRGDKRAVDAVIRAMRDPEGTIRVCVMASALGHLGDPRALSALTEAAFEPGNRDLRLCAIQSLGMIGDPAAVPALIKALQADNTPVAAANALARIGDERGVMPILQAAADPGKRLWMIMALGELGSVTALPFLQSVTVDDAASLRKAAQEAAWKIRTLSAVQPVAALTTVLSDEPLPGRRMWAAFRLGEYHQVTAVAALLGALADPQRAVRGRAAAALVRTGDAALPLLRASLITGTARQQRYVVAVLGYAGNHEDIELLQQFTHVHGAGELAGLAQRSIDLIQRFMQPDDGFQEYARLMN